MPDATVTIEGKEHTVDVSSIKLPDGHKILTDDALRTSFVERETVDKDYVLKDTVETTIQDRLKRVKKESVTEAAQNPEVVSAVLAAHKGKDFNIEETRKQWEEEKLAPALKQLESMERRVKGAAINAAAKAANARDEFIAQVPGKKGSYMEIAYGDQFEYDPDLDDVVVVRDGNRLGALDPEKSGRRFMNAEDFFTREAKTDAFKPFLKPPETSTTGTRYGQPRPGDKPADSSKAWHEKTHQERLEGYVATADKAS